MQLAIPAGLRPQAIFGARFVASAKAFARDRDRLALAVAAATVAVTGTWLYARSGPDGGGASPSSASVALPVSPPPLLLRPVLPGTAIAINRAMAFSREPNPPAAPLRFSGEAGSLERALNCLTTAIYYEAASEPKPGQQAVAQVILNRARHPAFPQSICDVVYQGSTLPTGCQFSFTCDGSLNRPVATREWLVAETLAKEALAGSVFAPVGYATHYHADFVVPYWNTSLAKNAVVGRHIFYRWPGVWGRPKAFSKAVRPTESDPLLLRAIALAAREQHRRPRPRPLPEPQVDVSADARVELLSVVSLLAQRSAPAEADSSYVKAVRAHFGPFADHRVVELFAERAAKDAQFGTKAVTQLLRPGGDSKSSAADRESAAAFAAALKDFAQQSKFDSFFEAQQPHYKAIAAQYDPLAGDVAKRFQAYTGMGAGGLRIVVAPLFAKASAADCRTVAEPRVLLLPAAEAGASDKTPSEQWRTQSLLSLLLARQKFAPADCQGARAGGPRCARPAAFDQSSRDQIAAAVAARIAPTKDRSGRAPASSFPYAATIAAGLTAYETNRRWFPTFDAFYPVLLKAVANAHATAQASAKAKPARRRNSGRGANAGAEGRTAEPLVCL